MLESPVEVYVSIILTPHILANNLAIIVVDYYQQLCLMMTILTKITNSTLKRMYTVLTRNYAPFDYKPPLTFC